MVVSRRLLWTLPHAETALKEWHRFLKNGGVVLIIEGVWKDRSLPIRANRILSDRLARIFGHTHGGHYDKKLRSCDGGVPEETIVSDLEPRRVHQHVLPGCTIHPGDAETAPAPVSEIRTIQDVLPPRCRKQN